MSDQATVTACSQCGCTTDNRYAKYCGDGSDKDDEHRWAQMTKAAADELAVKRGTWTKDNDPYPKQHPSIPVSEIASMLRDMIRWRPTTELVVRQIANRLGHGVREAMREGEEAT